MQPPLAHSCSSARQEEGSSGRSSPGGLRGGEGLGEVRLFSEEGGFWVEVGEFLKIGLFRGKKSERIKMKKIVTSTKPFRLPTS